MACCKLSLFLVGIAALRGASVFPPPREVQPRGESFRLDASVHLLLPREASAHDAFLARFLTAELSDRHGLALQTQRVSAIPAGGRFILMGSAANPLVREYGRRHALDTPGPEGYVLDIGASSVVVAGTDDTGAFYGLQSLRQLIDGNEIPGTRIRDWPYKPFRGIKMYLPGRENIAYFKRFVRNFMALYKFNKLILEMNAAMRFDRHPELNAGWLEFGKDMNYTRRERSWGPGRQFQDSANADTADSEVLEKEEVADLVRYCRRHHIEVIPEIPTLTHSYYLLTRHRELAEITDAEWPDTYCPSEPKVYDLVFDVLDEYIDVMHPGMVHIGHDEWRMPLGACPRCRGKDPTELYAQDLNRIYAHLHAKNVRTAIWADHLIEPLRGKRVQKVPNPRGTPYEMPGGLSAEQVRKLIPRDILMFNWFWQDGREGQGEADDNMLQGWGFQQVYGNMGPDIPHYDRRSALSGVLGGAPSSWAATNELNFGKDLMFDFLGCAGLLWSTDRPAQKQLSETIQGLLPGIRRSLSAAPLPSDSDPVAPVEIAAGSGRNPGGLRAGRVTAGKYVFDLSGQVAGSGPIPIGDDVSSLIFLHASTKPARNAFAYSATWNYADTADLLGWYEITYQDGYVESIPIRYGVNILETGWGRSHAPKNLAYQAQLVDCAAPGSDRLTLFAFEWINPRFGKVIKEVRLKSGGNPVLLAAVSKVAKRIPPEPKPLTIRELK